MSKTQGWTGNGPEDAPAPASTATPTAPTPARAPTQALITEEAPGKALASPVPQASVPALPEALVPVPAGAKGSPTTQPPPLGTLRHFRIDKRIAGGGMGEVFLGYDTSLSRPVAVKTIRPELARDQSFLARFVREATAQANVVHPDVVQVYFVGEDHGTWFLAMQLVDGGSLHDTLSRGATLSWQEAARHMTAVAEGLAVAERLGIVHRDIKPSNILLDREGRALLSDFGLAASKGTVDTGPAGSTVPGPAPSGLQLQLQNVTQVGAVMGTPEYVAPEQLKIGPLDARADMYALGASFFHLVSGKPVMAATTLGEAIDAYARGHHAPPLRTVAPSMPKAFAAVVDRCLEPDPSKRYATMAELVDALKVAMPQPEVPASPPLRALVWALDVAPFLALSYATYMKAPWVGPALFLLAGLLGIAALGATPGIWMMRLRLRTVGDGDVSLARGFARFLVQHGWYVPLAVGWSALYGSSDFDLFLVVGAVWLAVSVLGSLAMFGKRGQALHDIVTGTRVLVDVRYR